MTTNPNDVRVSRELLPCPYCGRAARYVAEDCVDNSGQPWPFAECDACNTGAPVEFWNKRAQPADRQGKTERNQCDGCQAGIPIIRGCHRMGKPSGYSDLMSCTAKLYSHAQPAMAKVDEHKLNIVVDKVDDICEKFELEGLHSHPTYKQFKRLYGELARAKLNGGQS